MIGLGVIAVGLDVALWNLLRTGHPYTTPIVGIMTRRGIGTADPTAVLGCMTALLNAVFASCLFRWFVPGFGKWVRKTDEENPGNFDECWKCLRNRPGEQSVDDGSPRC